MMEDEKNKNWIIFVLIIISLWAIYLVVGFFILNTPDLDKLSARILYFGLFMFFITYYSVRRYNETGSHLSYLLVDIPLIALIYIVFVSLIYYTSIVGLF